jgi:fibronectin-binding autotransporter adhesin
MRVFYARGTVAYTALVTSLCGIVSLAQVCQADVIGYWRLEGSGTVGSVADSSTNGLTGTGSGLPAYSSDVPSTSILNGIGGTSIGADTSSVQFGGSTSSYIDIPYNALLQPDGFTIEFFMKANAQTAWPGIVQKRKILPSSNPASTAVRDGNITWGVGKADSELEFARVDPANSTNNKTWTIPGSTADGNWHHFALTYSGGTWTLYQDYTKVATLVGNYTIDYDGLSGLRFGYAPTDFQAYNGLLDEVRFSNTVLTPSQFLALAPMTLQWGTSGGGGTGTWDAQTTANWYAGSGASAIRWNGPATTSANEAVFAGTAGAVTIDAGGVTAKSVTFNTAGYTIAGTGKLTLTTPSVVANQDATISAPIAPPAAGLNKSGAATLTLSGPNINYIKPTTVSAGAIRLSDTANFASPVTLGGGNLELAGSTNWSIDVPISGNGSVIKTGSNTVTLYNTSSYDGQTTIAQGTLRLGAAAVPTSGLAAWYDAGVGVTTTGSTVTAWADRTGQHNATAVGSPTLVAIEISGQPAVDVTPGNYLAVAGSFVAKSVYTVYESPNTTFNGYGTPFGSVNYSGTNGGRTFLFENGTTNFWQDVYPAGVRKDGTALSSSNKFDMVTITQPMVLGADVGTAYANNIRSYYIGKSDSYMCSLNIAEILVYDHVLTSAEENLLGAYLAQKYGISTSYVGQAQDSIPNSSTVAIASGATFDLNGASETIGALADYGGGGGIVTNNAAGRSSVLTLAGSGSSTFSGTVQDGASPISLVKSGAGTQVLAGANTYSGTTAVAEGTLQLTGGANRLPGTTVVTMGDATANTSGKLVLGDAGGAVAQTITGLASAGSGSQSVVGGAGSVSTLTINNSTAYSYTGAIGGTNTNENNLALTKTGAGTQTLSGALSYTGATTVTGGTLSLSNVSSDFASNINNSTTVELTGGTSWRFATGRTLSGGGTYNKTGASWVTLLNGIVTASGQINVLEGRLRNDGNNCNWSGSTASLYVASGATFDMRADSVKVNELTGSGSIINTFGGGGTDILTVSSGSYSGTLSGSGNGSTNENQGRTGLNKVGTGMLTLSGAGITYSGDTTVTAGTLKLDGVSGFGSNINNSATVELYSGSGSNWGLGDERTITGTGTYVKTGPGRVSLPNVVVTASGLIQVQQGTLSNESNDCNWSGSTLSLDVSSGAIFDMRADSVKVNVLTGSGSIANSFGGGGTDILTVSSGDFSGPIGGSGNGSTNEGQGRTGLNKVSTGTLILSGASTYAGPTTVTAGTLLIDGSIASPVTVSGGTLGGNGAITGNVVVQDTGNISAGDSPGQLSITGSYEQTGAMLAEIGGYDQGAATASGYDWIEVTGAATLDGSDVAVELLNGFHPETGDVFNVLTATEGVSAAGLTLTWDEEDLAPAQFWDYRVRDGVVGGTPVEMLQLFVGVPEPASLALAALGLIGLLGFAWRRRRQD